MACGSIELLEVRSLLSTSSAVSSYLQVKPNETIDQAHDLGTLVQPAKVFGSIGNGPNGAADVTWYQFELTNASRVDFHVSTPSGLPPFASVLSLFNNDPQDYGDPYDLNGHRLLAQAEANPSTGGVALSQQLGPGDYFVAVSGAGNLDFSPVIAGSGFDGATGTYSLVVSATDLGLAGDGPTVVSSDPAPGAVQAFSPLAIRLEMSGPLDSNTIVAGQNVELFYSPLGTSAGAAGTPVALASVNFSTTANELQLFPQAALAPGNYTVYLAGNSSTDTSLLTDPNGVPLGEDPAHPAGTDEIFSFQVDGIDGVAGATASDNTAATARQLGNVAGAGLVQIKGAIGDDPFLNPNFSPDPTNPEPQYLPANQVDLYHFQITGAGRYAMLAEVFAGRIGSPLDSGLSLYELDPDDGQLVFLAGDNNTFNQTQGTDGTIPLFTDSALSAGLTAGDYYLAVAGGSNTPSPVEGQMRGSPGILDPNQPGSAQLGWSTGPYILNVLVQPAPSPPRVLASSPSSGQVLVQDPTQLTVQFSEPINLQQLAFQAFAISQQETLPQVFVEGPDGSKYYPRFLSFDRATNQAKFQMLDGLPDGSYALHLSGSGGLTDLAGNPIVGNDPSGDYVIPFSVLGPERDVSGDMTNGYTIVSWAKEGVAQDLGVLFPRELQAGVTINRGPDSSASPGPGATADQYLIQLLQSQNYSFTLSGNDLPVGAQVTMMDASGQPVPLNVSSNGLVFFAPLKAGTYAVAVGGWSADQSATVSYELMLNLVGQQDNAPPLVDGPAPALQIQLEGTTSTAAPVSAGGFVGGNSGILSVALPGPAYLNSASTGALGGLASLGMSPLGGVMSEAGPVPAPSLQVALGVSPAPVLSSLVSLVTLTQVFSFNQDGQGIETPSHVEQPVAETSNESLSIDPDEGQSQLATQLSAGPHRLASKDPASLGDEIHQEMIELAEPATRLSTEATVSPGPVVVAAPKTEPKTAEPKTATWAIPLVITGAVVTAAFRGRRAIHNLKWRKRVRAAQPWSAGPNCPRSPDGGTTVTWPPHGIGHAVPHRMGHSARRAGSLQSPDVR